MKRAMLGWFVCLLLFFTVANLAGTIRPSNLKPYRITGFPYTFMAWGIGVEEYFDWRMLGLDLTIALISSAIVAVTLALLRKKRRLKNR